MAQIPIQFQLDDQAPKTATLTSDFKLSDFHDAIRNLFGDKYWMYSFICHGKSFDTKNEKELEQMKALLVPGMTLFMYTRLKGSGMNVMGTKFINVANELCLKRREFVSTAPAWRIVRRGLCLEGKCTNGKCEAHQQMVIASIGLKELDLNREKRLLSRCPLCQSYVNPITCGFNNCQWIYEGQIQRTEDDEPTPLSIDWKEADDAYHRFDPKTGESVNWIYLILETKAL